MRSGKRLSFLADVHVPRPFVTALRLDGFAVTPSRTVRPPGTSDRELLARALELTAVFPTNDRDFAALDGTTDHAGIIIYASPSTPAGEFRRGIHRIDRQFTPCSIRNTLLWLEVWV